MAWVGLFRQQKALVCCIFQFSMINAANEVYFVYFMHFSPHHSSLNIVLVNRQSLFNKKKSRAR
jgi:hypothetical protein